MAFLDTITLPQAAFVALGLYVAWRLVRPLVVKSTIKNIAGPPSSSFLTGSVTQFIGRHSGNWRRELSTKYGRTFTIRGLFNEQWVVTHDPKAFQHIFLRDQESFEEPILGLRILLGPGLSGSTGEQHRRQRKMLSPAFSSKHLRNMTPLFYDIIHKTRNAMMASLPAPGAEEGSATDVELDMLSWMSRTTLEVLGQGVLGYSFDPLVEDAPDEFLKTVKAFFPQMQKSIIPRVLLPYFVHIGSAAFRRRVVEYLPSANIQRMKDISDILHARAVLIFNEKKAALARGDDAVKHQVGEGQDVMSILLKNNMYASAEDKLRDDEILSQVSGMILAGMDATANSITRILHLLSEHPDVQERLRAEISAAVEAEGNGDTLEYERLMALPYLDAICRETLRRYPGIVMLFREVTRDTVLPLATPVRGLDGELITAVPLPKNTRVTVDMESCNLDPALWGPDASEWKPERWLAGSVPKEVEEARIPGVFSHMMTFLAGNRACIGLTFAQLEIKTVLLIMLQHFRFEPTGAPIVWNTAAVTFPTVGRESETPALPLKVSRLRP